MAVVNAYPVFWEDAKQALIEQDRVMRKIIPAMGDVGIIGRGDAFETLACSIIGQQISVKAAQTVWGRFLDACEICAPEKILKMEAETLRACGLSKRKAEYMCDLADSFHSGRLAVNDWKNMSDEVIIADLTKVRGIGRWTAEMFLMFNLMRPNVLPVDDLGLQRGISKCYFSGEPVSISDIREVAANWEPWRTVGSWYLWRSLDPVPVEY